MRLEALDRVLRRVVRRMRLQRALETAAYAASASLLLLALLGLAARFSSLPAPGWRALLLALLPWLVPLLRALMPLSPFEAARRLDHAHRLHDTLQTALELSGMPAGKLSTFGAALLQRAEGLAATLSPSQRLPLHVPGLRLFAASAAALVAVAWLPPVRTPRAGPHHSAATTAARARLPEAPLADELESVEASDVAPEQRELVRAFRAGEISRAEAILGLLGLERRLRTAASDPLLRGELLERVAALFEGAAPRGPKLRTLRSTAEELHAETTTREQRQEQQRFLEEKRRELEKLRKEHAKSAAERRELQQLSRQLDDAAKASGAGRPQEAAEQLSAAEQRVQQGKRTLERREQQQRAADKAAQLRELLQRQQAGAGRGSARAGGVLQREQQQRFAERAQGSAEARQPVPGLGGSGDPAAASAEPSLLDRAARPRVKLEDHAASSASGDGPARSEVVLSAAERGFASESYRKVYGDYRQHAEALLEQDQVPSGSRYYVRRYFQLIRPRGGAQ